MSVSKSRRLVRQILVNVFLVLLISRCSHASSAKEPHPHQGVVTPFQPGDPKVKLDGKAKKVLKSGKPHQTQIKSSGTSGRGLVVQDVHAPTSIVWDRILDYNNYAKMVPKAIESKNYAVEKHRGGRQTIYTRMKVGFPVLKLEFFVKHEYYPRLNSLVWTLDYSKKSDFDDSCGYWYVVPHPENKDWTRVYYSVQVSMFSWVPKFVTEFMSTKALTDATGWVKKFSELEYQKQGGSTTSTEQDDESPNKKRRIFGFLPPLKPKSNQVSTRDTCAATDAQGACVATTKGNEVSITRVALLASVFVLVLLNIHLYFS